MTRIRGVYPGTTGSIRAGPANQRGKTCRGYVLIAPIFRFRNAAARHSAARKAAVASAGPVPAPG